jgi:cytochrome c556
MLHRLLSSALLACVMALTLSGCDDTPKDTHPDQLVTKRRVIFKQFTKTLEPMGLVARERKDYNAREFLQSARELDKLASQPWVYFTADGNYPPTHAKPAVWQQPAEFKEAKDKYLAQVKQLLKVAEDGNLELIRPAVNEVEKSCKSCHKQFRNDS